MHPVAQRVKNNQKQYIHEKRRHNAKHHITITCAAGNTAYNIMPTFRMKQIQLKKFYYKIYDLLSLSSALKNFFCHLLCFLTLFK
jgi:hypothetical protein